MPRCGAPAGWDDAGENIRSVRNGDRLQQRLAVYLAGLCRYTVADANRLALVGKRRIKLHEVFQRDTYAAEPNRQSRRLVRRQDGTNAGAAEAHQEPRAGFDGVRAA